MLDLIEFAMVRRKKRKEVSNINTPQVDADDVVSLFFLLFTRSRYT